MLSFKYIENKSGFFLIHVLIFKIILWSSVLGEKYCFSPAICDGNPTWLHMDESGNQKTCQNAPNGNMENVGIDLKKRADTLRQRFENQKALMETNMKRQTTTMSTTYDRDVTTSSASTLSCDSRSFSLHPAACCYNVCDEITRGVRANKPVGLATRGSSATIYPDFATSGLRVYCDCTDGDDKAWTVFQRRMNGSVDFYRFWSDYENGFGNTDTEFWLGLNNMNMFTKNGGNELKVELEDWDGNRTYAEYSSFMIGNSSTNYTLILDGYNGTAGDSMLRIAATNSRSHRMPFSTRDRDNDRHLHSNCAQTYEGAWWYNRCYTANLNGKYYGRSEFHPPHRGILWNTWKGFEVSLKSAEMKFRRT